MAEVRRVGSTKLPLVTTGLDLAPIVDDGGIVRC
jgi:hypothetical protein